MRTPEGCQSVSNPVKALRAGLVGVWLLGWSWGWAQDGWARYRVFVPDAKAAQALSDSSLLLFSEAVAVGQTDVVVGPGELPVLRKLGLRHAKVSPLPEADSFYRGEMEGGLPDYRTNYLRYNEIISQYEIWRAQFPLFITRTQIGLSWQNRPVWAYRISLPTNTRSKKTVFLQAGIHAREWISPATVMYLFRSYLDRELFVNEDPRLFGAFDLVVIPVQNPDGYEYTWTSNRYWRKNRRNNGNGTYGVDLNRNYSKGWGGQGSSGSTSSDTYRGPSAFSEPETRAVRDYLARAGRMAGFIDYHSYSQLVLHPWGYTTTPCADDALFNSIGMSYRDAVFANSGLVYNGGAIATTLYLASGGSNDWAYDAHNIPAFAIELRDTGEFGFLLPTEQIIPTQEENWAGFKAFLTRLLP